ncbi:protein kinase, partial [Candidatus Woesearchaeota archaeon]|nr:protein kinase [Candidatus Woesearchaeota archaeon]
MTGDFQKRRLERFLRKNFPEDLDEIMGFFQNKPDSLAGNILKEVQGKKRKEVENLLKQYTSQDATLSPDVPEGTLSDYNLGEISEAPTIHPEAPSPDDVGTLISDKTPKSELGDGGTCFEFSGAAKRVTQIIQRGLEGGGTVLEISAGDGSKESVDEHDVVGFSVSPDGETKTINNAAEVLTKKDKKVPDGTKVYSLTKVLGAKQNHFTEVYETLNEVARGGMGKVLRVYNKAVGREEAMKVALMNKEAMLKRFQFEARVTGQLEHSNIIRVYDVGKDHQGNPYYTMEFIRGESLEKILKKQKQFLLGEGEIEDRKYLRDFNEKKLLNIFLTVCDAFSFAHSNGIINRDSKPENIMVGKQGILVVDWGLAKQLGASDTMGEVLEKKIAQMEGKNGFVAEEETNAGLTMDGTTMGTPAYMPPEQVEGDLANMDQRADIYSLGGILYEILTKEKPFEGASVIEIFNKILTGKLVPPNERAKANGIKVPPELSAIVMKAMAVEQNKRYGTVDAMAEDVRRFLNYEEVSVYKYGVSKRGLRLMQRHPIVTAGVGLFLLGLGVLSPFYAVAKAGEATALEAKLVESGKREEAERKAKEDEARRRIIITGVAKAAEIGSYANDYEREIDILKDIISNNPNFMALPYVTLGNAYLETKRFDEALQNLNKALEIEPDYALAHYNKARVFAQMGKDEEALLCFQEAIKLKENYSRFYNERATIWFKLERWEEFLTDVKKC